MDRYRETVTLCSIFFCKIKTASPHKVYFKHSSLKVSPQEVRGRELADYEGHCSLSNPLCTCAAPGMRLSLCSYISPARANSHPRRFLQPLAASGKGPVLGTWLMDTQRELSGPWTFQDVSSYPSADNPGSFLLSCLQRLTCCLLSSQGQARQGSKKKDTEGMTGFMKLRVGGANAVLAEDRGHYGHCGQEEHRRRTGW